MSRKFTLPVFSTYHFASQFKLQCYIIFLLPLTVTGLRVHVCFHMLAQIHSRFLSWANLWGTDSRLQSSSPRLGLHARLSVCLWPLGGHWKGRKEVNLSPLHTPIAFHPSLCSGHSPAALLPSRSLPPCYFIYPVSHSQLSPPSYRSSALPKPLTCPHTTAQTPSLS